MLRRQAPRSRSRRSGRAPPRSAWRTNRKVPSVLLQIRACLVERTLDERTVLVGTDLATEDAACGEDHHRCDLGAQLRQRLIVEVLRVDAPLLADAVGLRLRVGADVHG